MWVGGLGWGLGDWDEIGMGVGKIGMRVGGLG